MLDFDEKTKERLFKVAFEQTQFDKEGNTVISQYDPWMQDKALDRDWELLCQQEKENEVVKSKFIAE